MRTEQQMCALYARIKLRCAGSVDGEDGTTRLFDWLTAGNVGGGLTNMTDVGIIAEWNRLTAESHLD